MMIEAKHEGQKAADLQEQRCLSVYAALLFIKKINKQSDVLFDVFYYCFLKLYTKIFRFELYGFNSEITSQLPQSAKADPFQNCCYLSR